MKLLGGRYETLKAIASGGMATVHLGRAVGVGGFERLVAVKVMHPHIACEPEFVSMFLDEARLAARIRHPNVVATIDVQEVDDGLFLVMEFVDGPSLSSLAKAVWQRDQMVPVSVSLRIMLDALAGLHEAHELLDDDGNPLHLVHRDVSPANILVGADGVVRLTDFGVARAEARLSSTRGGQLKGKVPYMPPEQLLGESLDRRCDVYAAGAVLWEILVGRRLFAADNDGALVQQIIMGPKQSPRDCNPAIPPAVDRVTMRALTASVDDRLPSAAAFAEQLELAAAEDGVPIATSRAVAAFVEQSGAYRRLDPKQIAALKRAPSTDALAAATLGSSPSAKMARAAVLGSTPSAKASLPSADHDAPVPVTATEAAVSATSDAPLPSARRKRMLIAVGVATLALGVVGGALLASGPAEPPGTPRAEPAVAPAPSGQGTTPDDVATTTGTGASPLEAAASSDLSASSAAPSTATSASASTPPASRRPPKGASTATSTATPTKPPPITTSYNPDRL